MKKTIATFLAAAGFAAFTAVTVPFTALAAGWLPDETGKRYEKTDGTIARNGWEFVDNFWFCFDENGYLRKGWTLINGAYYYLEPAGAMNGTVWMPEGAMWFGTWTPDGYYVNELGIWVESAGRKTDGSNEAKSQNSGASPSTDTSVTSSNGWVQEGERWKYKTSKGFLSDTWKKIGGKRYYFGGDGYMVTGFQEIDGAQYYFRDSGEQQTKTFEIEGTYYVIEDGEIIEEVDEFDWSDYKKENKIKSVDKTIGDLKNESTHSSSSGSGEGPSNGGRSSYQNDEASGSESGADREKALEAVDCINREREKKGLEELSVNEKLMDAAEERAEEITELFSHTRPDGSSAMTVLKDHDLSYSRWGENIALGYATPESVTEGWMNSSGHKKNILTAAYQETGVACYVENGVGYWVQIFYAE